MLVYWLMFLIPVSAVLFTGERNRSSLLSFLFVAVFFILLVGFRHEVGGDWYNYLFKFDEMIYKKIEEVLKAVIRDTTFSATG